MVKPVDVMLSVNKTFAHSVPHLDDVTGENFMY